MFMLLGALAVLAAVGLSLAACAVLVFILKGVGVFISILWLFFLFIVFCYLVGAEDERREAESKKNRQG